jgi:Resolvase, N terminal domain
LILTVFAGVATFERKRIRERQREGIDKAKREGRYKGGAKRFADADIWALDAQGLGATEIMRKIGARSTSTVYRALERRCDHRAHRVAIVRSIASTQPACAGWPGTSGSAIVARPDCSGCRSGRSLLGEHPIGRESRLIGASD